MNSRFFVFATLAMLGALRADTDTLSKAPDTLVLKDGRVVHGLIIKNSSDSVLLQSKMEEKSYPKNEIVRIRDEPDTAMMFTESNQAGDLPPWRIIANDLRTHDSIRSLEEIPATMIDQGEFRNVPYRSFRVNRDIELNIYGDPEDPAGIELGIYGSRSGNDKLRRSLRSYLAGYLATRREIAALYSLSLDGGLRQAGELVVEVTPRTAPDAYGAWWISLYNKRLLADTRLSDTDYAKLTRPMSEVTDKNGRLLANGWTHQQMMMSEKIQDIGRSATLLLRGFYRDKNGDFRLLTQPSPTP
jgi:hypothetical protein